MFHPFLVLQRHNLWAVGCHGLKLVKPRSTTEIPKLLPHEAEQSFFASGNEELLGSRSVLQQTPKKLDEAVCVQIVKMRYWVIQENWSES